MDEWMLPVIVMSIGLVILAVNLFHLVRLNRDLNDMERRLLEMRKHSVTHLHGHVSRRPEEPPHGHQPRPAGK